MININIEDANALYGDKEISYNILSTYYNYQLQEK